MTIDKCEATKSLGYDPTGEWAVPCGAPGEYCPVCEFVVCDECHEEITAAQLHGATAPKKPSTGVVPAEGRNRQERVR